MKLDKQEFKEFLVTRKGEKIGISCNEKSCPIGIFLITKGYCDWVEVENFTFSTNDGTFLLPPWAIAYVAAIDEWGEGQEFPVSQEVAITLLS